MYAVDKKLHWTQRIALTRHSLSTAIRTRDFTFFKSFQAQNLTLGIDHVASLNATLEDDADALIFALDKSNAVIACVYEDAFKTVYDSVILTAPSASDNSDSPNDSDSHLRLLRKSKYHATASKQLHLAASAVDKMVDLAVTVIHQQPAESQEDAATVFVVGTSFIADAVQVCLSQVYFLEHIIDDPLRLDAAHSLVQSAVASSISAMKGVFSLMNAESPTSATFDSSSSAGGSGRNPHRTPSIDSYARSMLRKMSNVLSTSPSPAPPEQQLLPQQSTTPSRRPSANSSRRSSVGSIASPTFTRRPYFTTAFPSPTGPQSFCPLASGGTHALSPIPPTPADMLVNPFEAEVFDAGAFNAGTFRSNSLIHPPPPRKPSARRDSIAVSPLDTATFTASSTPATTPTAGILVANQTLQAEGIGNMQKRPSLEDSTLPSQQSVSSSVAEAAIYESDPLIPPSYPASHASASSTSSSWKRKSTASSSSSSSSSSAGSSAGSSASTSTTRYQEAVQYPDAAAVATGVGLLQRVGKMLNGVAV